MHSMLEMYGIKGAHNLSSTNSFHYFLLPSCRALYARKENFYSLVKILLTYVGKLSTEPYSIDLP